MSDLLTDPLDTEAEWLMVRIYAEKGRGKNKTVFVQHGIGRTEEEALRSVDLPKGYKLVGTPNVIQRDIDPESYERFYLPVFDAIRGARRKAAKRG